jgi:E3 ubiquitin-protein ligase UBR4
MEAGQMSDATASGPASDDEAGSMAAADGSMLQTSPVERGGSGAGSDSGGSQVESVSGKSMLVK